MKTAIVIWICAIVSGVGCVGFVNASIDTLAAENLQGSYVQLQPADNTVQVTSSVPLQSDGDATDIQPALGYKALNWQVTNLKVQQ